MDKSRVKEILIKAKDSPIEGYKGKSCKRAYRRLKRQVARVGSGMLFDSFYLVEEAYSEAVGRVSKRLRYYASVLLPIITVESLRDDVSAFFEVMADSLTSDECEKVKGALLGQCIVALAEGSLDSPELIRSIQSFDFTPFMLGFLKYEQILRRDAVYPLMDKESRALYKDMIRVYSKKRGLTFTEGCQRLMNEGAERDCHIGELLPLKKGKPLWLLLPLAIFLTLEVLLAIFVIKRVQIPIVSAVLLLSLLPLWQASLELSVPIAARFTRTPILPRLECQRITADSSVLSVITALGTNVSEVKRLVSHLEELSLKTFSRGRDEGAYWGLLLDLPESDSPTGKGDKAVIREARQEIERLNKVYGDRFVFLTRDRVYSEVDKIYTSRERKRGAIEELVKLLMGKDSALRCYGAVLPHIKYVLTLDADTDMELGALNRMVGTMEHPLNRPVVESVRGVKRVTRGFGILQPALKNTLESVHKTDFSTLMSGVGGVDSYHSAVFNLNSLLFGKGIFCGKGIFSVSVFYETVVGAFPEGRILSHDILEGTRLSAGYPADISFFDSVPSNAYSFYNRAHRWARGDIQALAFVGRWVKSPKGIVRNPMTAGERFVFLMNFINLVVPIFQVVGLFFLMWYGIEEMTLLSLALLLPVFVPIINEVMRASLHGSLTNILRRFFGDTLTGLYRESLMLGYRLSAIAFCAYKNGDAVVRALWRMTVSGRKLLEWTTASQSEGHRGGVMKAFTYTFPSFVIGAFMLLFARLSLCKLLGILWCLFFLIVHRLNRPAVTQSIPEKHKRVLRRYALDMWKYFQRYTDEASHWLPPDNVSVFPSTEVAYRTSPTNIGLYLLSVLSAHDLGIITLDEAVWRIERTVTTLEALPKYKGQLYNWYSTVTLQVIGQEYISTVDSGNFITCLVALYWGLGEYEGEDARIKGLRERIRALEEETDFRFLFDSAKNLFALGYFTHSEKRDSIYYDMYMSEARTTDYYAIARGIVKGSHWSALSRPLVPALSGIGVLSWSGTAFEYFMPHLLLPLYKNSFAQEALSYAFSEQTRYCATVKGERVFGISESGYFAFDEQMNYKYRAFGIPSLSRRVDRECQKIISPYSSFLMLRSGCNGVMKNLERLESLGMYGELGFYEALDCAPSHVGNMPSVVKSYMSHHIGMSMVAVANAVLDDIFVRRFMADPQMRAVDQLLKESVPADVKGGRERLEREVKAPVTVTEPPEGASPRTDANTWALTGRESTAVFYEGGLLSLDITSKGERISALRPLDSANPCALYMFSKVGDEVYSPAGSPDVSHLSDTGFTEYRQGELKATVSLSATFTATRVRLEARGESGCVGLYFQPLLTALERYLSHPAFNGVFFTAGRVGEAVTLTRKGESPFSLAIVSSAPFEFELSRERLFEGVEYSVQSLESATAKPLSSSIDEVAVSPCVFVRSSFSQRTDTTFVIGWGRTVTEAVTNAMEELSIPYARSVKGSRELFYSAVTASGGRLDRGMFHLLLSALRPQTGERLRSSPPVGYGRNALYSLGLSGTLPVFLVKCGIDVKELGAIFSTHKLHYIMGIRYDLVLEVTDEGYSRGGRGEAEALADSLQCSFLLGRKGGIHLISNAPKGMLEALATAIYPSRERLIRAVCRRSIVRSAPVEAEEGDVLIREKPPVLWSHIIASPTFGTMLSHRSLGSTWVYSAGLSRITLWENDSLGGGASEKVYARADGVERDLCASASAVRFSFGRAEYMGDDFTIRVAIHPTLMFKAVSVTLDDSAELVYRFLPVLDDFPRPSGRVEYHSPDKSSVIFKNLFSDSLKDGFGYLFMPYGKELRVSDGMSVGCQRGSEALFILGYANSERHFQAVKGYFASHSFKELFEGYTLSLKGIMERERLPWIAYQTLVSRFYARGGPYQSGGARGFRDQAQDCLAVIDLSPSEARAHILRMAAHQYREGDVQHWWHHGKGIRTLCSDDYLWLVWVTALYIDKTGDESVLGVQLPYLESPPLGKQERERYEKTVMSGEKYPLSHHLKSAMELFAQRGLGDHSLPFILGGDWNDGMNMLPQGSESVWLAFFGRIIIYLYERVTGDDSYKGLSQAIREGIEKYAFFSDRYARVFLPHGRVLGVEGEQMEIDCLPQAFASICHSLLGDGDTDRITLALDSAWRELYDGERMIFKLFKPPFKSFDKDIGYLSAYPEGVRENGGQYTHGAVWMGLGFLSAPEKRDENRARAIELGRILDPKNHPTSLYKGEPYVLSGDVYINGHGGWSWYTGSAAWYREFIFRLEE